MTKPYTFPKRMFQVYGLEVFRSLDGFCLSREYCNSPNQNPFAGRWVLRDQYGNYVDHDQYRNDITERRNLVIVPAGRSLPTPIANAYEGEQK